MDINLMNNTQQLISYNAEHSTELGEELGIPFTIINMQNAKAILDSLQIYPPNPISIRSTHKYIKFFPTTEEEVDLIETSDSLIYFSEEPLHYERILQGGWYREPNLPNNQLTPIYACVPNDYTIPNGINYTIIEELYIPDEDMDFIGSANPTTLTMDYINYLMYYAHKLIGHPDETHFIPHTGPYFDGPVGPGLTYPLIHGTIKVFDTRLNNNIPLEGVTIKAIRHRGFGSSRIGVTNNLGQYNLSGTQSKGSTNYIIHFKTDRFNIQRPTSFDTRVSLKKQILNQSRTSFSYNISIESSEQHDNMAAQIFRAAYMYYYKDIDGLKRPRNGGTIKILATNGFLGIGGIGGEFNPINRLIQIAQYKDIAFSEYWNSDDYFAFTIHELGHASHQHLCETTTGAVNFASVDTTIIESWSTAIQWHLTSKEYRSRGISNYGSETYTHTPHPLFIIEYGYQWWNPILHSKKYTTLFINLVDDFNEMGVDFNHRGYGSVNDDVTGYTLPDIEQYILPYSNSMLQLANNLQTNRPSSVTWTQLNTLISFYEF